MNVSLEKEMWEEENFEKHLCGTTRRTFGYPSDLDFSNLPNRGDSDWRMTDDGLLAVSWMDVGQTKAM